MQFYIKLMVHRQFPWYNYLLILRNIAKHCIETPGECMSYESLPTLFLEEFIFPGALDFFFLRIFFLLNTYLKNILYAAFRDAYKIEVQLWTQKWKKINKIKYKTATWTLEFIGCVCNHFANG